MLDEVKSAAVSLDKKIKQHLDVDIRNKYVVQIQDLLIGEYDSKLVGVVSDRQSKTNPVFYKEEFVDAIKNFEYLPKNAASDSITVRVPDITNFPFNYKRLTVIKNILEGIVGNYVEVNEDQYVAMFKKKPALEETYDKTVSAKERIYLLKYTADLQKREMFTFKRQILVRYPFSNVPPINIFGAADEFVKENLKKWVDSAMKEALEDLN